MLLHSTLAFGEDGVALGALSIDIWSRDEAERGKRRRRERPFEEKESYKWYRSIERARALMDDLPEAQRPRLIHVADREADVHEVLQTIAQSDDGCVIRSAFKRKVLTAEGKTEWAQEVVARQEPLGEVALAVPRKGNQPPRTALVDLRACRVHLDPSTKRCPTRQPIELNLLWVQERKAPRGAKPLNWLLWTTEPVESLDQALRVVAFYKIRWKIEEYHMILKSGCHVEELRMDTAERIAKTVSMYVPVAVRLLCLRDLARTQPDAPCTEALSELEWRVLWTAVHKAPLPPQTPTPAIAQAVRWIGQLGGHLGRKGDGMPGVRTLWRGFRDLEILTAYERTRLELFFPRPSH
jgi:hypothetical protein